MARLADGDPAAFDSVFEAAWPMLRKYCARALGSVADADDAAQRALMKMLEQAPNYDRTRPALAWALGFAYWECRTEQTRRRRHQHQSAREPASTDTDPEELSQRKQQQEILDVVLANLSEAERALIVHELATAYEGAQPAALRKRRQRLLAKLKAAVALLMHPKGEP